jgi:hypothetical protein
VPVSTTSASTGSSFRTSSTRATGAGLSLSRSAPLCTSTCMAPRIRCSQRRLGARGSSWGSGLGTGSRANRASGSAPRSGVFGPLVGLSGRWGFGRLHNVQRVKVACVLGLGLMNASGFSTVLRYEVSDLKGWTVTFGFPPDSAIRVRACKI